MESRASVFEDPESGIRILHCGASVLICLPFVARELTVRLGEVDSQVVWKVKVPYSVLVDFVRQLGEGIEKDQ